MVFGDTTFEEVLLFFDVHHFGEPGEGVGGGGFAERSETTGGEAAVGDVVDVLFEFGGVETQAGDGETVADEFFFEADAFGHGLAEVLFKFGGPDVGVFIGEVHEEVAEKLDVIGFVAQSVTEHLADTGEFVLSIKAENHAEEAVKLSAFHALAEEEHVFGEGLFVFGEGHVHTGAQLAGVGDVVGRFLFDGFDVFEHGFAFMRVDTERGDHVNE